MSDASIVQVLTLNTLTKFNTSASISRVKIHNDSSMYLRVYFGSDPPQNAAGPGWHDTIGPGGSPLMAVVGANVSAFSDRTNYIQSTPYLGVINVMPFFPVGATTAGGGVVTGASLCYLTGYFPYEEAEAGGQVEAFVQAAKQGRYQEAGPGSVIKTPTIQFDNTTASPTLILLDNIGGTSSPIFLANQAGTSVINFYLFGWGGTMENNNPNVATNLLQPDFAVTDVTGAVVRTTSSVQIRRYARAVNFGVDSWWYAFPNPILIQFSFLQGVLVSSDQIRYRYVSISQTGTFDGYLFCSFMTDKLNQSPLFALPGVPAPPSILSNQPYNSVYNPQTY